ncbi:hypothetical protein EVAR_39625_1 [Eumeta japonica]|uniref:THAP-type domain-containing protein n=1 Tax=Eumeta variegata TaxID=151549 RepID=A0A4C1WFB3_EUMVA|nr:hypothetical protein EVAR_39625_1 [Eumeta japonica]
MERVFPTASKKTYQKSLQRLCSIQWLLADMPPGPFAVGNNDRRISSKSRVPNQFVSPIPQTTDRREAEGIRDRRHIDLLAGGSEQLINKATAPLDSAERLNAWDERQRNPGPFHRFPYPEYPNLDRFNLWKAVLAPAVRDKGDLYIYNNVRFCDSHFEERYRLPSKRLTRTEFRL